MLALTTLLALASASPAPAPAPAPAPTRASAPAPAPVTHVTPITGAPAAPAAPPIVAVVPLDAASARNVAARAIFLAVDGALPEAAAARGLGHRRFAIVKPVDEAARACGDDACRRTQAKRLGARYALVVNTEALKDGALTLRLLDDAGAAPSITVRGPPPWILSQAPIALATLLEQVAPRLAFRRSEAIARMRKARAAGQNDVAARICFELAAMVPAEMASWTFEGADLLADAGQLQEATAIFAQLALDDSLDEDVRLEALARSRVPLDSAGPDVDGGAG